MAQADAARPQSTVASLIAGSVGGAAQVLVGQPLDTIKTRAQTAPEGAFKGPMDIARQTIKREGFFALYKGMASPLIGIAGVNSLLFASNAAARRLISPYPDLSIAQVATAGAIAGAAQSILASPVEMFKGQYEATGGKRLRDVVGEMYAKYGWRQGIMRGYWITVVREIPAYAGFYVGFETSKRKFQKTYGKDIPVWAILTSGGLGGIGYWTACYPLDVVKSRIQLAEAPPRGINYIVDTFRTIYRQEGLKAFFKGLAPTYIRAYASCISVFFIDPFASDHLSITSVPAAASTFCAFELTMDFLLKHTSI